MMKIKGLMMILILVALSYNIAAFVPSNESVQVDEALSVARQSIVEMQGRLIPVNRVNETYQEALQLYSAQFALEEKTGNADYTLILKYTNDIETIKESALNADDELKIFIETFKAAQREADLSEMQQDYDEIVKSFKDERFEDTTKLIDKGYDRISEIQSEQTATRLFYSSVYKSLKSFFVQYWMIIAAITAATLILILIFRRTIDKIKIRIRYKNLLIQKQAINKLITKMQRDYFKLKKMSEREYKIKLKRFKEMIREIDRQVMTIREESAKLKKGG